MKLRLHRVSADRWDSFLQSAVGASVFVQSWFVSSLEAEPRYYLLLNGELPLAGTSLLIREGRPISEPFPCTLYRGPVLSATCTGLAEHSRASWQLGVLQALVEQLTELYPLISWVCHPDLHDLRALQWFNYGHPDKGQFRIAVAYTAITRLEGFRDRQDYLLQMRENRRRDYHRAARAGASFDISRQPQQLIALMQSTFERQELSLAEDLIQLKTRIIRAAIACGAGEVLVGSLPCRPAQAAILMLYGRDTGYYLFAGNEPTSRSTGISTYLMIEAILRCKERGLTFVDFCGANSPRRGDFKTSLNGAVRLYLSANWARP